MNCPDANILQAFLDGRLPDWEGEALEVHLDRCEECRQVLAALACSQGALSTSESHGLPAADTLPAAARLPMAAGMLVSPGDQVDQYKIERLLGQGGMGEVFLARDLDLRRRVAIKFIRSELVGARDAVERFLLEARAAARLNHPGIVTVYGVGDCRGLPYIALEYVEGLTLRQAMLRKPLTLCEWLPIMRGVAEAATEAHRHGVVHGDLKPANVLLSTDGRVRTVDFGLARVVRDDSISIGIGGSPPDQVAVQGTPSYMAPELWHGRPATMQSDVWALAVMMIELCCGQVPFGPSQVARGVLDPSDVMSEVLRSAPAIPAVLLDLLVRCLDPSAEQRPSMLEMARTVKAAQEASGTGSHAARSVPPRPDGSLSLAAKARTAWAGWLVAALLVGAGAAWGLSREGNADRAGTPAAVASASPPIAAAAASVQSVASASPDPAQAPSSKQPVASSSISASPTAQASPARGTSHLVISSDPSKTTLSPSASFAPTAPPGAPSIGSRLMAVSSMEDKAEAADRRARSESDPARKHLAQQQAAETRSSVDEHLREIEAIGARLQTTEPANSAALLDYVRQAREMIRRRRASRTP